MKQMITVFKDILKCINAECYKESKECFELFGVDLMVDDMMNLKLIEVNTKIGFGVFKNDPIDINKIIFENMLDIVLLKNTHNNFIKL